MSKTGKMMLCAMLPIFILLLAVHMVAGEYCQYDDSSSYYSYKSRYCSYGCCGNKDSSYSDVCCSLVTNSYSSEVPVAVIVGSVIGGVVGLSILIVIIKCCCAAINNSNRQIGTVIQPKNTAVQTFVVNTAAVSQGPVTPVQQGSVGYAYSSAGPPPPYVQQQHAS